MRRLGAALQRGASRRLEQLRPQASHRLEARARRRPLPRRPERPRRWRPDPLRPPCCARHRLARIHHTKFISCRGASRHRLSLRLRLSRHCPKGGPGPQPQIAHTGLQTPTGGIFGQTTTGVVRVLSRAGATACATSRNTEGDVGLVTSPRCGVGGVLRTTRDVRCRWRSSQAPSACVSRPRRATPRACLTTRRPGAR